MFSERFQESAVMPGTGAVVGRRPVGRQPVGLVGPERFAALGTISKRIRWERSKRWGNERHVRTFVWCQRTFCSPILRLATVALAIAGCDGSEALPDLGTVTARVSEAPASAIEGGFVTWLDLISDKAFVNTTPGVFVLNNRSPRLVPLGDGWYGDPVARTVGVEFLHKTPSDHLHETTLIGGPDGETALLSQVYPGSSLAPLLVIRGADGKITTPLVPVGPDEEAIVGCIEEAAGSDNFDAVLDCLGLLDTGSGSGSSGGGLFPPGWEGLGEPDCDGSGIAMGGSGARYLPDSQTVLAWTAHAEDALDGDIYGPVTAEFADAADFVIAAGAAWHDANVALAVDPTNTLAQKALLNAAYEFGEAMAEFADAAHDLIEENYGSEPLPGEQPPASDPRCQQQETDSARGSLFANSDFCAGDDLLECLAAEVDPIRKITDGKCATVDNPLGGKMLKCNDGEGDPLEVTPGEVTNPASSDPLKWTDPTSPPSYQDKLHVRFVDTLDLGHVLVGLCAAGGCPRDPRGY